MKKWTAVQYDLSKNLAAVPTKLVKIPAGLTLLLIIELEDELYTRLAKDSVWLARMQEEANAKALPVIESLKVKIKDADEKVAKFDAKTAVIFSNDLNAFLKQKMDLAGVEMAKEIDKYFEEYKKNQKDLTKFRIKSGTKITFNAISIVSEAINRANDRQEKFEKAPDAMLKGVPELVKYVQTATMLAVVNKWWAFRDSNPGPLRCKRSALTN